MRLIYLSPVPLTSFAQRPHHFVHWFHQRFNAPVTWVEPYPARLPRVRDLRRLRRSAGPVLGPAWRTEDWIEPMALRALPLEPLAPGRWLNRLLWRDALATLEARFGAGDWLVAGKPCALALDLFARHPEALRVFDVMDNVPAFASGASQRWLARAEAALATRCDRLLVSATPLAQRFTAHADKLLCVRNGLTPPDRPPPDRSLSDGSASGQPSSESTSDRSPGLGPRPVFGYLGAIAAWFDWEAVVALAQRFPQAQVRLIGPCEHRPAQLPANVELLPGIPQDRVYQALAEFDVGLIPFRIDPLTECVDPVKYYEYRAMGLPVLSTRFGEMRLRGAQDGVRFFDELGSDNGLGGGDGVLAGHGLSTSDDLSALAALAADAQAVAAFRRDNTWAQRFEPLTRWAAPSAGR